MSNVRTNKGNPLGTHRVLDASPSLVQAAQRIDNTLPIFTNEVLLAVDFLQIDSASFRQLSEAHKTDAELKAAILAIVASRGKMQNPVTGSGGMLLGTVVEVGADSQHRLVLQKGDRIATLISLTATPLCLHAIHHIERAKERVTVKGHAILFDRSIFAKMPNDLPEGAALAAFDICGAPLLVKKQIKAKDSVLLLGLGKAGRSILAMLDLDFKNQIQVLGIDPFLPAVEFCRQYFAGRFTAMDASNALQVMDWVLKQTQGQGADVVVNAANVANTEMSTILSAKQNGRCLFFGMATDFQKAALGAEAVAQDVQMQIGSGYTEGHADFMLNLLRRSQALKDFFCENY